MGPGATASAPARRRILVAEDEQNLRLLLRLSLTTAYEVETVEDGQAAVEAFEAHPSDMVLLDIMMPRMDGITACQRLRSVSDVPIIMVTALGATDDIVKGFAVGADDYITKPFTFKELLCRIEAIFRRIDWMQPSEARIVQNGDLRINTDTKQVWVRGQEKHLTPIEFQLLQHLAARPGHSISKEDLFREVWGYDLAGGTNLVEVAVRRLREKVEADPSDPKAILTVRGYGYRFRMPSVPEHV